MRKVLIAIMAVAMSACTMSEQDKAEKLISNYLDKNANDPSSVEIIEVGVIQIDSVKDVEEVGAYLQVQKELIEEYNLATDYYNLGLGSEAKKHDAEAAIKEKVLKRMKDEFKPYSNGKYTKVEYRAKNAMGALVKQTAIVRFDDELTKITEFTDK